MGPVRLRFVAVDLDRAIVRVRSLLVAIDSRNGAWNAVPMDNTTGFPTAREGPALQRARATDDIVIQALPVGRKIAEATLDAGHLVDRFEVNKQGFTEPFEPARQAALQLIGILESQPDLDEILGPQGQSLPPGTYTHKSGVPSRACGMAVITGPPSNLAANPSRSSFK